MKKQWFILINGTQEGPYDLLELKRDRRITPDTFVWRKGFTRWERIRDVPELRKIFKDETPLPGSTEQEDTHGGGKNLGQEVMALNISRDPTPFLFWFLTVIALIVYFIYKLYAFK